MTLLIVSSFTISHLNQSKENVLQNKISDNQHNARILAEAKAALLGFAVSYAETHLGQPVGYLPCPNTTDSNNVDDQRCAGIAGVGKATSGSTSLCVDSCKGKEINVIGCLPWKTLGIPRLQDSSGNDLWYAVSGTYKDKQKSLTNDDDNDNRINIKNNAQNIIAIIIAPDISLLGQDRPQNTDCSSHAKYIETSFNLDAQAADTVWILKNLNYTSNINDKFNWITTEDYKNIKPDNQNNIYDSMLKWVANRVQSCLVEYIKIKKEYAIKNSILPEVAETYPWVSSISTTSYNYSENKRFGYVANNIDEITNTTSFFQIPKIINLWQNDCFNTGGSNWWNSWREKIFIAIDRNYAPNGNGKSDPMLKIDEQLTKFVILVKNKKSNEDDKNLDLLKKLAAENPPSSLEIFKKEDSSNSILCSDQSCL